MALPEIKPSLPRGDARDYRVTCSKPDGSAWTFVAGDKLTATVKRDVTDTEIAAEPAIFTLKSANLDGGANDQIEIEGGTGNVLMFYLLEAHSLLLSPWEHYRLGIVVESAADGKERTVWDGILPVIGRTGNAIP